MAHRRPRAPDEDGYLYFEGRSDDLIISAGYRIGPFEVESALVSHAAVAEAAVVAAPDDERGSVVRAVVVLRDGFAPSDELAAELQEHVREQTAPYKYPRIVDFAPELPKTASGKVQRAVAARPRLGCDYDERRDRSSASAPALERRELGRLGAARGARSRTATSPRSSAPAGSR